MPKYGMAKQVSRCLSISDDPGIFKLTASLDSSLKKNTAFIKRLRTSLNADNQAALLKDIAGLIFGEIYSLKLLVRHQKVYRNVKPFQIFWPLSKYDLIF